MSSPQSGVGTVHVPSAIGAIPAKPTRRQMPRPQSAKVKAPAKPTTKPVAKKSAPQPAPKRKK